MPDDDDVLGALPEVPEDLWERVLTVTFTAPPGDDDLALLPDAGEQATGPGLEWADVDDQDHHVEDGHHDVPDHGDVFEALPLDDHQDQPGPDAHGD